MSDRHLKRSIRKAQGLPLRNGPARASDGTPKGPASVPSREEMLRRRRAIIARAAERVAAEKEAATIDTEEDLP